MQFSLCLPFGYSEIGNRPNNEDSIYPDPSKVKESERLFLVCDGVGGAEKGEVASELACASFAAYFENNKIVVSDKSTIKQALNFVESAFDEYIAQNPATKGMATTATLLHLHENGATIAHVGDSRVYVIREGNIIFQTKDHSFAMELFEGGFITIEQAMNHPRKNEITRAIQGKNISNTRADVYNLDNLQNGDIFFLCSDGVMENINENLLEDTIRAFQTPKEIGEKLIEASIGRTKDNFSAYIIKIDVVKNEDIIEEFKADVVPNLPQDIPHTNIPDEPQLPVNKLLPKTKTKKNNSIIWIVAILLFAMLAGVGYYYYSQVLNIQDSTKKTKKKILPELTKKANPQTDSLKGKTKIAALQPDLIEKAKETVLAEKNNKKAWNSYLFLEKRNGFYGLVNKKGDTKLAFNYDEIETPGFEQGKFNFIRKGDKYGFIFIPNGGDIKIIEPKFSNGFNINADGKTIKIKKDGKTEEINLMKLIE